MGSWRINDLTGCFSFCKYPPLPSSDAKLNVHQADQAEEFIFLKIEHIVNASLENSFTLTMSYGVHIDSGSLLKSN